jgi:hypothetical protein
LKGKKPSLQLATIFVAVIGLFVSLDISNFPDYESYRRIFDSALLGGEWEVFFVFANFVFIEYGLSYDVFRICILLASSLALWMVLHRLWSEQPVGFIPDRVVNYVLIAFLLAVFVFEFFIVRIRSGFAIGLFCYAIYFVSIPRALWSIIVALIFIVLAFFTHQFTTAVLSIMLGIPYFFATACRLGRYRSLTFDLIAMTSVALMLMMLLTLYESRGEHLSGALHSVRFVMLAVVPVLLFFVGKSEIKRHESARHGIDEFPYYFIRYYGFMAAGLILFYVAGLTAQSGEAIVRLYTLSSLGALFSISITGSVFRAPISSYLVLINALFFIVTVFSPH